MMRLKYISRFGFLALLFFVNSTAWAVLKTSTGTGPWTTPGTWSPSGVPTNADDVTIVATHTITMDGNTGDCLSLTIDGTAHWTATRTTNVGAGGIIISATGNITGTASGVLTSTGGLQVNATTTSTTVRIQLQTNAGQTISGTGSIGRLRVSATATNTGTLTVTTALDGASTLTNAMNAVLNVGNSMTITGLTATAVPNTINYTRAGAQTIKSTTYHHLGITNSGTSTLGGDIAVNGDLTLSAGTLALSSYNITGTASGLLTAAASTIITIGSTTVATSNTFPTGFVPGNISLNATSRVTYQANAAQVITTAITYGNLTISGGASTVSKTLDGATLNITGTLTLGTSTVTLDAEGNTINLTSTLSGAGGLSFTTGTLNVSGSNSHTGTFTCGTGLVNYNRTGTQTVRGTTYNDLIISGSSTKTLGGNTIVLNDLTISGGTLDVSTSNRSLNVGGDFTNNSVFNARSGTLTLDGGALQNLGGSTNATFYNLTISNTTGVQLSSAQTLRNTMILGANAQFDVNGQTFLFLSTSTYNARIGTCGPGAVFTGDIVWRRYIPGTTAGWSYLGSPLYGVEFYDWQDDFLTSGYVGSSGYSSSESVYWYDESTLGDINQGYESPVDSSDDITPGVGYMAWVGANLTTVGNITVDITGNPVIGSFPMPVTYNDDPGQPDTEDGWNFICNPYACEISWAALLATASDPLAVEDAIYVWNADLNSGAGNNAQYVSGVSSPAVGAGGIGNAIPAGQCFFIHLTGPSTLTAEESIKTTSSQVFLRTDGTTAQTAATSTDTIRLFRLHFWGDDFNDETVLRLEDGVGRSMNQYDALKLSAYPGTNYIYSKFDSVPFSIKSIPTTDSLWLIPIHVGVAISDTVTIAADHFAELSAVACVQLVDRYTGDTIDLRTQNEYTFFAYDTTVAARFHVLVSSTALIDVVDASCFGAANGSVTFTAINDALFNYQIKDTTGAVIAQANGASGIVLVDSLLANTYLVFSESASGCGGHTDSAFITQPEELIVSFDMSEDTIFADSLCPVWFTNTSSSSDNIFWIFGDGVGTSNDPDPLYFYENPGSYDVVLTVFGDCGPQSYVQTVLVYDASPEWVDTSVVDTNIITQVEPTSLRYDENVDLYYHQHQLFFRMPITEENATLVVYDVQGRAVMERISVRSKKSTTIPALPAGIYVAVLEHSTGIRSRTFVVTTQ